MADLGRIWLVLRHPTLSGWHRLRRRIRGIRFSGLLKRGGEARCGKRSVIQLLTLPRGSQLFI